MEIVASASGRRSRHPPSPPVVYVYVEPMARNICVQQVFAADHTLVRGAQT